MDIGRERISSGRFGVARLVVSCPIRDAEQTSPHHCLESGAEDSCRPVGNRRKVGIQVDPDVPFENLRDLLAELEDDGHRHAAITVAQPLTKDAVYALGRVARAAALNARSLRSIRIETGNERDFERLRLCLGFPI